MSYPRPHRPEPGSPNIWVGVVTELTKLGRFEAFFPPHWEIHPQGIKLPP